MKALVIGLCVSVSAWAADPLAEVEKQQQELFNRIAPAVVFISNADSFGSGFFVSAEGLILTNAHVVRDAKAVQVVLHDGRRVPGEVVERAGDDVDLALVQVKLQETPKLELAGIASVSVGSWVGAVGHGHGAIWTFNAGMISNIYPSGHERPVFQTQIPLNPGNSGGPIFDRRGRVIGVVTAGLKDASAINFGITVDVARRVLSRLASSCDCLTVSAPKGLPVFVNGTMVGTGPKVVVPATANTSYEVFTVIAGQMKKTKVTFPAEREVTLK
jgi:serine protease Do